MDEPRNPFPPPDAEPAPPKPRLRVQFTLKGLLVLTVGCALVFGVFRLMGLTPQASLMVTGLIGCGLAAGAALVAAIAKSADNEE